jgi:hypothetical protein
MMHDFLLLALLLDWFMSFVVRMDFIVGMIDMWSAILFGKPFIVKHNIGWMMRSLVNILWEVPFNTLKVCELTRPYLHFVA